jgi:hypothetical protein
MSTEDIDELVISESTDLGMYEHRYNMKHVIMSASSAMTVTLPNLDTRITLIKATVATVTIQPKGVDTLPQSTDYFTNITNETFATINFKKSSGNNWYVLSKVGTWNYSSGATLT